MKNILATLIGLLIVAVPAIAGGPVTPPAPLATTTVAGKVMCDGVTTTCALDGTITATAGGTAGINQLTGDGTAGPAAGPAALTVSKIGGKAVTLGGALTTTGTGPTTLALPSGAATFTYPAATSTLASLAGAEVLTNKTIACNNNTCTVRIGSDVSGLGSSVATALAINIGSAGAFLKNNGDALSGTFSGNFTLSGTPTMTGLGAGTIAECAGFATASNVMIRATCAGGGGSISVTDDITTVNPATTIEFTSGATVTDAGGGVAQVAVSGGGGGGVTSVSGSGGVTVSPTTGAVLVSLTNQCPIGIDTWDGTAAKTIGATTGLLYTTGSTQVAAGRALNLPTVASYTLGCALTVVDLAAIFNATNLITPTRQSSDTIDGATTGTTLGAPRQSVTWTPTVAGKWATIAPPTLAADVAVTNQFVTAIPDTGIVTRAQPAASNLSNGVTGSGAVVLAAGGALTGVTGLGIRDTSAAFDVTIAATSSTTISAGRILTIDVQNAAQTLKMGTAGTKTFPDGSKTLLATDLSNIGSGVLPVANIGGSPASHAVPVDVGGTSTYKAIPDCTDTTGNHLNFTQSTDAFSCGSTVPTTVALLGASQSFTKGQAVTPVALTDGATPAVDASLGNDFTLTMVHTTSARTIQNPSNLKAGQTLNFFILQDGTGGATYAFGSQYKFSGATAPTATAAASAKDVISCRSDTTTSMMCSPSYDYR